MERRPGAQGVEIGAADDGRDVAHRGVLHQHQLVEVREVGGGEVGAPIEAGRVPRQGGNVGRVVGADRVASVGAGPARARDVGLQRHDRVGLPRRVGPVDHAQHRGDVGLVLVALRGELRLEVLVAVRQAALALAEVDAVAVGVLLVGRDRQLEHRVQVAARRAPHQRRDRRAVRSRAHGRQVGGERGGGELLDPRLVGERAVERADLVGSRPVGGARRRMCRRVGVRLQYLVNPRLGQVGQHDEVAGGAAVGRDDGVRGPAAVAVAEEVVARHHGAVQRGQVVAPGRERAGGRIIDRSRRGGAEQEGGKGEAACAQELGLRAGLCVTIGRAGRCRQTRPEAGGGSVRTNLRPREQGWALPRPAKGLRPFDPRPLSHGFQKRAFGGV